MKQQIIITIEEKDKEDLDINITFQPSLAGRDSKEFEDMSVEQRGIQNVAQHLAHNIIKTCNET